MRATDNDVLDVYPVNRGKAISRRAVEALSHLLYEW